MTITITRMSGLATVQDAGRPGHRAAGVPLCGAMDARSFALANALVGNRDGAATVEWALGGGSISFGERTVVAVAGADVELSRDGSAVSSEGAMEFAPGERLTVGRFVRGAFLYLAVRGGIGVPAVLGSRSTYLPAGFGGLDGRRLRAGDVLPVGNAPDEVRRKPGVIVPMTFRDPRRSQRIRAIEGPNTAAFSREFRDAFWSSSFAISRKSDRVGYRLEREPRNDPENRGIASEPACVGAIQIPSGAGAFVLMADGPTVGGYPKIGVVASVDLPALAQKTPGETVVFELIAIDEAQRLLRADAAAMREARRSLAAGSVSA